ncbi:tryptophan-rich sensory protein [Sporosarcina sp. PTS2304]|uniref:tryptophan-rich sensory protein n=1 Tax=Sporosarcina sp. PTS2304 TaxID=2283194 RepID=UPI000E0D8634|nr:tryptophan-rich sensory protein [Sporosarcina sp. PTS2304]AXI00617.1 tryptophan-rich sensory protein [Sporosarcina sp. PTS2304]
MNRQSNSIFLNVWMISTYLLMITVNALANILPINGQNTGEISDKYRNLFAPAGFTFSIWGVIYLLLAFHIVYQLGLFRRNSSHQLLRQVAVYFTVSSVLNALWIFCWHYDKLYLSVLIMIGMLLTLLKINNITTATSLSWKEKIFIRLPFSVYFGWITIATIANITALLVSIDWNGFGISEVTWTIIILFTGAIIGIMTILHQQGFSYGLVLLWAYYGIYSKHIAESGFDRQYPTIINSILVCIVLIAVVMTFTAIWKRR